MSYNGHKNWTLWIGNDPGLYQIAIDAIKACDKKDEAAEMLAYELADMEINETPDGAGSPAPQPHKRGSHKGLP